MCNFIVSRNAVVLFDTGIVLLFDRDDDAGFLQLSDRDCAVFIHVLLSGIVSTIGVGDDTRLLLCCYTAEVMLLYNFVPNCRNESVVLTEFSKLDTARFCLAHLYTYRCA